MQFPFGDCGWKVSRVSEKKNKILLRRQRPHTAPEKRVYRTGTVVDLFWGKRRKRENTHEEKNEKEQSGKKQN